jgi:hypothetical protein
MTEYELTRANGRCHVTGRPFTEGEQFFSALFETPQGFERRDFSVEAWEGPPAEALCHFPTRLPRKEEARRKLFVDSDVLINLFLRLADHEEALKLRFRFVLSLIMLRKRLLKYERTIREGGKEFWEMRLMRDKTLHRVFNPALEEQEIQELTGELGVILAGDLSAVSADTGAQEES